MMPTTLPVSPIACSRLLSPPRCPKMLTRLKSPPPWLASWTHPMASVRFGCTSIPRMTAQPSPSRLLIGSASSSFTGSASRSCSSRREVETSSPVAEAAWLLCRAGRTCEVRPASGLPRS